MHTTRIMAGGLAALAALGALGNASAQQKSAADGIAEYRKMLERSEEHTSELQSH